MTISSLHYALLALGFAGTIACTSSAPPPEPAPYSPDTPAAPVPASDFPVDTGAGLPLAARSLGSPSAPVTVYEMSDFQCPFCRRNALETFPVLRKEYVETGKVRWVFINFPLTRIHPNALPAAEFAVCAARAGKFWPAHDLLYAQQPQWENLPEAGPYFLGLADSLHMDRQQTLACLQNPATEAAVQADAQSAARAGATSTPSFYIEGGILAGAAPPEAFRPILDSIYAARTRK